QMSIPKVIILNTLVFMMFLRLVIHSFATIKTNQRVIYDLKHQLEQASLCFSILLIKANRTPKWPSLEIPYDRTFYEAPTFFRYGEQPGEVVFFPYLCPDNCSRQTALPTFV
ncbi:MAG: hypothetical protein JWP57_228, partial [Spirosoma sp.]|nr:hypothetical protein [Spirosoma sp.]